MRIRVLPLGFAYIFLSAVVSAAAANTGNNALYMIAALMLALLVVSGILSTHSLGRLAPGRASGNDCHARSPTPIYVEVLNRGRWTLCGIRVNGRPCPPIPPRGSRLVRLEVEFPRRGLHDLPPLELESRFPFGFLARSRRSAGGGAVLVFPALDTRGSPPRSTREEEGMKERSSRWGEILDHRGLKPFQEGEDPRHIHWKKSAQRGQLVGVEYDRRSRGSVELFLNTREPDPARFEHEIEGVAGSCDALSRRGAPVALSTPGARIQAGTGEGHRRRLLGFLALVEREP